MPTRVLLEGSAIEPLLAQVRDEYGSRVRIISADKVRSGGVGGFFAKQHYELSVEVPDPTEDRIDMAQRTRVPENGHPTLEKLLERAESQDRIAEPADHGFDRAALATDRPHSDRPATQRPVPDRPAVEPDFGSGESRLAAMGDTGAAFAELMAGLNVDSHEATSAGVRSSSRPKITVPIREETPTVRPFRPATATGSPVNSPGSKPMPPMPSLAERIGGLAGSTIEEDPVPPPPEPEVTPAQSAATVFGLNPAAVVTAGEPNVVPVPAPMFDPVVRNLISVGMPESMASKITGGDTYAGVLSVLAARPATAGVPDGPGEILVLAGDVNLGVTMAKQLLEQIGVGESHLLLAAPSTAGTGLHSSKLISSREVAESRVEKLHSADAPWIVVMDAPVGGTDPLWVNDMCDAIGATAVWAIVDATRKTADTARHLRTLGEVEALVVHGVELTADPASVLGLDLPIFSLDGKPATPHAWAAMLCARIAADVMPMAAAPRRVARTVRQ